MSNKLALYQERLKDAVSPDLMENDNAESGDNSGLSLADQSMFIDRICGASCP